MYITHKSQQKTGASKKFAYSPKNKFELNNLSVAHKDVIPETVSGRDCLGSWREVASLALVDHPLVIVSQYVDLMG